MDLHRWQQYSFQGLQNGSMHIDVHPDIAERLNNILSAIVPLALPADRMAHSKKSLRHSLYLSSASTLIPGCSFLN